MADMKDEALQAIRKARNALNAAEYALDCLSRDRPDFEEVCKEGYRQWKRDYRPATSPDVAQWAEEAKKEQEAAVAQWQAALKPTKIEYSGQPTTSHDPHETNLA